MNVGAYHFITHDRYIVGILRQIIRVGNCSAHIRYNIRLVGLAT